MMKLYNNIEMPEMGAGTYPYKEELSTIIPQMVEVGYRLFDTSDNYHNESFLCEGLSGLEDRLFNDIVIISKYSNPFMKVKNAFALSSKNIFINTSNPSRKVDVYLMHWPYPYLWKRRWKELENLYMEGECKAIGVCNFTVENLKELMSFCKIKPMINQLECHPLFQQRELIEFCEREHIQVISYSPLARVRDEVYSHAELLRISNKYNKSVGQIILKWNVMEGRIPIPASKNIVHIRENYEISDFSLEDEELQMIDSLDCGLRIRYDPAKRFALPYKIAFFLYSRMLDFFK